MASYFPYCILSLIVSSLLASSYLGIADGSTIPKFAFSWLDDKNKFQAGEIAGVKIKVLGDFEGKGNASFGRSAFKPMILVNEKTGNSSYISGVSVDLSGDPSTWKISFTPIVVGVFNVIISDENFKVLDSSLDFEVEAGQLYPSVCVASWMGLQNEFEAGANASVLILPKDAFGNNISSARKELDFHDFWVSFCFENGSVAIIPDIKYIGWNEFGYIIMQFVVEKAGNFLLHVEKGQQLLNGASLPFKVNPGQFDVSNCVAKWKFELNVWQIFSKMEIFLYQQDHYGNIVPGVYEFDADVVEKETNLSVPVADLQFEYADPGIQLFSFSMLEPGNFFLTISDMKHNKSISNMPYAYTVYVGYCDGSTSVVNGSGLNSSVAGDFSEFSVYLRDAFGYSSSIEVEKFQVQILREIDSSYITPSIRPREILNSINSNGSSSEAGPALSTGHGSNASKSPRVQASIFDIAYNPQRSGIYRISILCGNIVLNGGQPFTKEVKAGEVDASLSSVTKFNSRVSKQIRNEIVVLLVDTNFNPVMLQQFRLKLEVESTNTSGFTTWMFEDNNDGIYTGSYLTMEVGTYKMCVLFDSNHVPPCPFEVNVYSSEYFPKAYDDMITVWEDESIAFDALANDYFAGDNASIIDFSQPDQGSLLQYGRLLRYTPFKDFSGNDSFLYTITDVNGNLATAAVNISILTSPPQFVSFPRGLQAIEDQISPRFCGFSGLEIRYSDEMENISVTLSALSGTIILSPMLMQFWQPMWRTFSVSKGGKEAKDLILEGRVEAINIALQSIQYLGNENFAGVDALQLNTRNRNGINKLDVPVFVEPVNDPPFIHLPEFITLKDNGEESLIFDKKRDKFEFSVGDPDLLNFPGGESRFLVTFSVEVSEGFLRTSLPAELINSTELKFKNSFQWQPLQTYVSISRHFMVKANGIRFQGTLKDCKDVIQQLVHDGGEHGAVLMVKVSDMGHYGCYLDCAERISLPLLAQANVKLIRRRPISSLAAHALGSAIVIESLVVLSFGILLLFFTCKCAILLVKERRRREVRRNSDLHARRSSQTQVPSEQPSEDDATNFTGCFSHGLRHSSQRSHLLERSCHQPVTGTTGKGLTLESGSSAEPGQQSPESSLTPLEIEHDQKEETSAAI